MRTRHLEPRRISLPIDTHVVAMPNGNTNALTELQGVAAEALAALDTCRQISPFSERLSAFDLDDAYHVTAAIRQMREMRGEMPVGRKIGFTNRTVWAEYGPIWGYVYNRTLHNLAEIGDTFSLVGLVEPRIEPEIIFELALAPYSGTDEISLFHSLSCFSTRVWSSSLTCGTMEAIARIACSILV